MFFQIREQKNECHKSTSQPEVFQRKRLDTAQATIEFIATMIMVLLIMYGAMKIFEWSGVGIVERRMAHDNILQMQIQEQWLQIDRGPIAQTDPNFYEMRKLNAVFGD